MKKFRKLVSLDSATLYPSGDARWAELGAVAARYAVEARTAPAAVAAAIGDSDAVLTNKTPITAATIALCPNLKYIGVLATGYNIVDTAAAAAAGITVCNVPSYSTASVAQTAIALLLALVETPEEYAAANREGRWQNCPDFTYRLRPWRELSGKTMGIVGFGNTGRATAGIAAALGMTVKVFTSKAQSDLPAGYVKADMDEIFRTADVLSLHCPLTPATAGLVNAGTLAMMKPTALIINTARGPLVDEAALAAALREGRIAGAGVDVLSTEPPAPSNPLLSAPNCIVTPHIAWSSDEARARLFDITINNLKAYLAGKPANVVASPSPKTSIT